MWMCHTFRFYGISCSLFECVHICPLRWPSVASRLTDRRFTSSGQIWYQFVEPGGWKEWFACTGTEPRTSIHGAHDRWRLLQRAQSCRKNLRGGQNVQCFPHRSGSDNSSLEFCQLPHCIAQSGEPSVIRRRNQHSPLPIHVRSHHLGSPTRCAVDEKGWILSTCFGFLIKVCFCPWIPVEHQRHDSRLFMSSGSVQLTTPHSICLYQLVSWGRPSHAF